MNIRSFVRGVPALFLSASAAVSQEFETVAPAPHPITTVDQALRLIGSIANVIYTVAIVVSIFFTLFAAYTYMSSGGNEEKVAQATHTLQYVAIGIAVAILAAGLPLLVANLIER